jgi:hypothetical protein
MSADRVDPEQAWIWVNRWEDFQSFQTKRGKPWAPPWIRLYPALLADDVFISLGITEQLLLLKLFMLFSSSRQVVANSTRTLSQRTGQRVLKSHIVSLNEAGFIDLCSRTVLERRRNMFWNGSVLEVEVDKNLIEALVVIGAGETGDNSGENGARSSRALADEPL